MKVTRRSRRQVRLQNILFVLLFLAVTGLLAWAGERYSFQADWTANSRNTLSETSAAVLKQLPGALKVSVFTGDSGALKQHITDLLGRYQRYKKDIEVVFVNPDTEPDKIRQLNITADGEMLLEYEGRNQHVTRPSEEAVSNALQRLSRRAERWLVFVEGHGERSPFGKANYDLQSWGQQLESKGFHLKGLNLASKALIPDNTSVLVIAGPQVNYLPGEVKLIEDYVSRGGNLLWLADPGGLHGMEPLAEQLGITFEPGVIVDPTTRLFSINNPAFAIVGDYGMNPVVDGFNMVTIFPYAAGLALEAQDDWQGEEFLQTAARSWSESSMLAGEISFDDGEDVAGPLSLAVLLTRQRRTPTADTGDEKNDNKEQRILVTGDGDFLSNAYIGNGGNLDLGMNMINWLSADDQLLSIPAKTAIDSSLNLSKAQSMVIGFGFLLVLPVLLLGSGLIIWLKRRKA
jgi:ABC-type uncharacterized transport system involved in gliding motility auxiliary subunit